MVDEEKTRMEEFGDMLPELERDEEEVEEEKQLSKVFKSEHKLVWKELENQVTLATKRLEGDVKEFQKWYANEEIQEMETSKKARNVIKSFGSLLSALNSERDFIMGILKEYIDIGKELGTISAPDDGKDLGKVEEPPPSIDTTKLVLFLCIDQEFKYGEKGTGGRGRITTMRKISDTLNLHKDTVIKRLKYTLSSGYADKLHQNLTNLLKDKKRILGGNS